MPIHMLLEAPVKTSFATRFASRNQEPMSRSFWKSTGVHRNRWRFSPFETVVRGFRKILSRQSFSPYSGSTLKQAGGTVLALLSPMARVFRSRVAEGAPRADEEDSQ